MRTMHDLAGVIETVSEAEINAEKQYWKTRNTGKDASAQFFVWHETGHFLSWLELYLKAGETEIEFGDKEWFTWGNIVNYWERTYHD